MLTIIELIGDMVNSDRIKFYLIKVLVVIIITLIVLIGMKASSFFKTRFYRYVYDTNIPFAKNIATYKKYLGGIFQTSKASPVFNEQIIYEDKEPYLDGVRLSVGPSYVLKNMKAGIVIDISKNEEYGQCLTIQQIDELEVVYCNVSLKNLSLYDYVEQGQILGEVQDNLYLIYKKNGNILNYEDYLP